MNEIRRRNTMKIKFKLLVAGLLLLIPLSCSDSPDPKTNVNPTNTTIDDIEPTKDTKNQNWVIINKVPAKDEEIASLLFTSERFWKPTSDDVLLIEKNIIDFLIQNSQEFYWQPPVWQRLDEYKRQYIGLEREGRKFIFGNYFCENGDEDWRKELMFAIDGGECYFQVEFDLESGSFIRLHVNGES
jgi:hypothetical protein